MLTPQEEAMELSAEPMPVIICPSDDLLPTQVKQLDDLIARQLEVIRLETELLSEYRERRKETVDRAIKLVRMEDNQYCIVPIAVYPRNTVLVDILKTNYPNEYATICKLQTDDLQEKLSHVGEKVGIGEVKAVVKDKGRQAILIKPSGEPTYEYEVVAKK